MQKRTIKTNILSIFLILVGTVSIALLSSQYYFSTKLAISSTDKTFKLITGNILQDRNKYDKRIKRILQANINNENLYRDINFNYNHPALQDMIQMMNINHEIYAMYFAHKDGSFYEVVNMKESSLLYDTYKAPKETRWTIMIYLHNTMKYIFLDKKKKFISNYSLTKKYNPLVRPWYTDAINSKKSIRTKPYLFFHLKKSGVTYARELKQKGSVFAMDYTMNKLEKMLTSQKIEKKSEVFVFDNHGNILATSKTKINDPKKNFKKLDDKINFTKEEKNYIKNHPTLVVSNEDDWAPFDFQSAGEPMGYSVDYVKMLSNKSALKIKFVNGYTWSQIMNMFEQKDIDIVQSVYKNSKREKIGNFTKPIYQFKNYFITHKDAKDITSIKELKYKRVGVIEGWALETFLKQNHTDIKLISFKDVSSAFLALSNDKVDAIIETKESFSYLTKQLYIDNLKISGWCKEFDKKDSASIYMLVQKDKPFLLSILNKTMNSITTNELEQLKNKWFTSSTSNTKTKMIDPVLMDALLNKNHKTTIKYKHDNKKYFTVYTSIDKDLYLGFKIEAKSLLQPYIDNLQYSLTIALLLLIISIPIIILATKIIVKPIKALILENEKIKNRQFNKVATIDTNIIEFLELSSSFVSMSQSIQEYQKSQEELLDSIVKLIAEAVDAKSPYTGGHCKRVPEIAQMLVDIASDSKEDIFKDFSLKTKDELREFEIGAWLHDCGKVTTPEYVVDKSTKLETINDRIHEIRTRFEVLWRDAQIEYLNSQLNLKDKENNLKILTIKQEKLKNDFAFIADANIGGEFMSEDKQNKIKEIASQVWERNFDDSLGLGEVEALRYDNSASKKLPAKEKLISDKKQHIIKREFFDYESYKKDGFKEEVPKHLYNYGEVYNLCIAKGTLTPEERYKINEHVILSIKMLEKIPFPSNMTKIPEYAGTHHETLIGTGYPRKLTEDELSIPARIMALADVFEALTASDRPYKRAKTLSASIKIMSFMVKDKHLDEDIFKLFLRSGLHLSYAKKYLKQEQIDEVDLKEYL